MWLSPKFTLLAVYPKAKIGVEYLAMLIVGGVCKLHRMSLWDSVIVELKFIS